MKATKTSVSLQVASESSDYETDEEETEETPQATETSGSPQVMGSNANPTLSNDDETKKKKAEATQTEAQSKPGCALDIISDRIVKAGNILLNMIFFIPFTKFGIYFEGCQQPSGTLCLSIPIQTKFECANGLDDEKFDLN